MSRTSVRVRHRGVFAHIGRQQDAGTLPPPKPEQPVAAPDQTERDEYAANLAALLKKIGKQETHE